MIEQFCYIGDTHLAYAQPVNRIDVYNDSILDKIEFVLKYCQEKKIKTLVHGGDLLHSHHVKPETLLSFVDLILRYGVNFYYVYGNHDVQGANFDYVDKTQLGFLSRYQWFYEMNNCVHEFNNYLLSGYNYTSDKQKKDYYFPEFKSGNKKKVLVLHANIYDATNTNPIIEKIGIRNNEIETDADLVLCAHTHYGWKDGVICDGTIVINPGSVARVKYDEHINGFGPRLVHVQIDKNIKYQFVKIPTVKAFDDNKYKEDKKIKDKRSKFIEVFKKLSYSNADVAPEVSSFIENPPNEIKKYMTSSVKKLCFEYLYKLNTK